MKDKLGIGDLVRVKTHSDPIMRVVGIESAEERSSAEGAVDCEWDDHGTDPPTRRGFSFAAADLVPVSQKHG